jgi:hypothetical protein
MPATPSPAVVYTASFGDFVLGGGAADAGASREWERRTDAPLALRLTLGGLEDGEEAEIAARDLVRLAEYARMQCAAAEPLPVRRVSRAHTATQISSPLTMTRTARATSRADRRLPTGAAARARRPPCAARRRSRWPQPGGQRCRAATRRPGGIARRRAPCPSCVARCCACTKVRQLSRFVLLVITQLPPRHRLSLPRRRDCGLLSLHGAHC